MPSITVKMVKVPASDLRKNDVFTTVLRGEADMQVVVGKTKDGIGSLPFNYLTGKPNSGIAPRGIDAATVVRKVVGLKFVPAVTASEQ